MSDLSGVSPISSLARNRSMMPFSQSPHVMSRLALVSSASHVTSLLSHAYRYISGLSPNIGNIFSDHCAAQSLSVGKIVKLPSASNASFRLLYVLDVEGNPNAIGSPPSAGQMRSVGMARMMSKPISFGLNVAGVRSTGYGIMTACPRASRIDSLTRLRISPSCDGVAAWPFDGGTFGVINVEGVAPLRRSDASQLLPSLSLLISRSCAYSGDKPQRVSSGSIPLRTIIT